MPGERTGRATKCCMFSTACGERRRISDELIGSIAPRRHTSLGGLPRYRHRHQARDAGTGGGRPDSIYRSVLVEPQESGGRLETPAHRTAATGRNAVAARRSTAEVVRFAKAQQVDLIHTEYDSHARRGLRRTATRAATRVASARAGRSWQPVSLLAQRALRLANCSPSTAPNSSPIPISARADSLRGYRRD